MNQGIFGPWGLRLTSGDFARAAALAGLTDYSEEGDFVRFEWNRHAVPFGPDLSAEYLSSRAFSWPPANPRLRLALSYVPPAERGEVVRILAAAEVGADGIYLREDAAVGEVRWNWPLRVGFLADKPSEALYRALAKLLKAGRGEWREEYIRLIPPGELDGLGCHLLFLPSGLVGTLTSLAAHRGVVRTACALVLCETGASAAAGLLQDAIRLQTRTDGVALVDLPAEALAKYDQHFAEAKDRTPENRRAAWFIELVRALSHDRPLDAALFEVWRKLGETGMPPVVVASARLIRESRIRQRLVRLGRQLQDETLRDYVAIFAPKKDAGRRVLGAEDERISFGDLGRHIVQASDYFPFDYESDTGIELLDLLDQFRRARADSSAPPPRWVQAHVSRTDEALRRSDSASRPEGFAKDAVKIFQPGVLYNVDVFIGPRDPRAVSPPPDAPPLPEDSLPDDRGVTLTIVVAEAVQGRRPQVRRLFLPRVGSSVACRFVIQVADDAERVEARVIVLYRNRVLQTLLLAGPVAGRSQHDRAEISITPETILRDNLEDLETRRDFDATLVLNHTAGGAPAVTLVRDEVALRLPLPQGIEGAAQSFDDLLEEIADDAENFQDFTSDAQLELLRRMAQKGSLLWKHFEYELKAEIDLAQLERLQVVATGSDTRLPIEFFYDLPAPRDDAQLCEGAESALRSGGRCAACTKRKPEDRRSVVCPLGFWGLSKVLERHLHKKGEREPANELRTVGPLGDRATLTIFGEHLFATSEKVDAVEAGGAARIRAALEKACGRPSEPVATWDDWTTRVEQRGAPLLFIVPHVIEGDQPEMEIGVDSRLKAALIESRHVRHPPDRDPAPVVMLLGCKTGKAKVPFAELPGAFRMLGAAVVLSTGAPIVGRHAVRAAEAILNGLTAATGAGKSRSMGDVVRDARRIMLLDGLPLAFTILAFGDFDWQIAPRPAALKPKRGRSRGVNAPT